MLVLPDVFLGADAVSSLNGSRGFLYGDKRHRQVDVLGFEPAPEELRRPESLDALAERRLDRSEIHGWRIVGVAVETADLEGGAKALLQGLVAGDVVVAGGGRRQAADAGGDAGGREEIRVLIHRGDCLAEVRPPRPRGF